MLMVFGWGNKFIDVCQIKCLKKSLKLHHSFGCVDLVWRKRTQKNAWLFNYPLSYSSNFRISSKADAYKAKSAKNLQSYRLHLKWNVSVSPGSSRLLLLLTMVPF